MAKDIEWLKREVHKELEDWHGVEGGIDGDGINEIMLLINQHEESEVKRLERKMKELESYNDELIRDNNQLRKELDNQEVLSQEWIDEKRKMGIYKDGNGRLMSYFALEDLQNLLVPKQELPVIPRFVAEWIEETKPYNSLRVAFEYIAQRKRDNHGDELAFWVEEGNSEAFARAWLDGFTVEEGQKYRVIDRHRVYLLAKEEERNKVETVAKLVEFYGHEHVELNYHLTEQEIKDYDERFWPFAVKVEELNE